VRSYYRAHYLLDSLTCPHALPLPFPPTLALRHRLCDLLGHRGADFSFEAASRMYDMCLLDYGEARGENTKHTRTHAHHHPCYNIERSHHHPISTALRPTSNPGSNLNSSAYRAVNVLEGYNPGEVRRKLRPAQQGHGVPGFQLGFLLPTPIRPSGDEIRGRAGTRTPPEQHTKLTSGL
jgi:hypothetical protein